MQLRIWRRSRMTTPCILQGYPWLFICQGENLSGFCHEKPAKALPDRLCWSRRKLGNCFLCCKDFGRSDPHCHRRKSWARQVMRVVVLGKVISSGSQFIYLEVFRYSLSKLFRVSFRQPYRNSLAVNQPKSAPDPATTTPSKTAMIRANGQRLWRLGSIAPSTTTRIISAAGYAAPGTTNPLRKLNRKETHSNAATTNTAKTPTPKNALGRLTLEYGIFQKGIPTMKKHSRNAPMVTFCWLHRLLSGFFIPSCQS